MRIVHTWALMTQEEKNSIVLDLESEHLVVFESFDTDGLMDFAARSRYKGSLKSLLELAVNLGEGPIVLNCSGKIGREIPEHSRKVPEIRKPAINLSGFDRRTHPGISNPYYRRKGDAEIEFERF